MGHPEFSLRLALVAEVLAGNGGLAERDAAIVGRDFTGREDFKSVAAQGFETALEQKRVLKAPTAQANAVELEVGAHAAANCADDGDEGRVKLSRDEGLRCTGFQVDDNLPNHRAQIDVGWGGARQGEVIGVSCGLRTRGGLEHHRRLAFERDGVAQADERGDGVEEATG